MNAGKEPLVVANKLFMKMEDNRMQQFRLLKWGGAFLGTVLFFGSGLFISSKYIEDNNIGNAVANNLSVHYFPYDEIPAYPGVLENSFGDGLVVNNVPLRMSYFYTKDSPNKIANFYIKALKQKGLEPVVSENSDNNWNIYSVNLETRSQINISINQERGRTFVIPASMALSEDILKNNSLKEEKLVPYSEDAVGILYVKSAEETGVTLSYIEPNFDLDMATGYIRDRLGKENWDLQQYKPAIAEGGSVMVFKKKSIALSFLLSKSHGNGRGVAIFVNKLVSMD